VPDPTTNYAWDIPNVGGDGGSWGTVANVVFNAIDTQVKNRQNEAATAQADATKGLSETLALANALHQIYGNVAWEGVNYTGWLYSSAVGRITHQLTSATNMFMKLDGLVPNDRITAFTTYGSAGADYTTKTVELGYFSDTGSWTQITLGHTLGTSNALQTTSGPGHDVVANRAYYLKVVLSAPSSPSATLGPYQLTVTRP
jgi:hypothetical protein